MLNILFLMVWHGLGQGNFKENHRIFIHFYTKNGISLVKRIKNGFFLELLYFESLTVNYKFRKTKKSKTKLEYFIFSLFFFV